MKSIDASRVVIIPPPEEFYIDYEGKKYKTFKFSSGSYIVTDNPPIGILADYFSECSIGTTVIFDLFPKFRTSLSMQQEPSSHTFQAIGSLV